MDAEGKPWRFTVCLCLFLTMAHLYPNVEGSTKTIKLINKCGYSVWPAIASWNTHEDDTSHSIPTLLEAGESSSITLDSSWSGNIWGRLGCRFNATGVGRCESGDCGGNLRCDDAGTGKPMPRAITTATFTNGSSSVTLENGYNLPISVNTISNMKNSTCKSMACIADVSSVCPENLQARNNRDEVLGCEGSCNVYLGSCSPDEFSSAFERACPEASPFQEMAFCPQTASHTLSFCPEQ